MHPRSRRRARCCPNSRDGAPRSCVSCRRHREGAAVIMPDALLDEVTALVEWPAVYAGTFDPKFLAVPQECLILTMQQNQKYFALADARGELDAPLPDGQQSADTRIASAIVQRQRARAARAPCRCAVLLRSGPQATARDARRPARRDRLSQQARHARRSRRAVALPRRATSAPRIGADHALSDRAALLAKADLVTDMVGEFPELQGTMGRYYALHDGEAAGRRRRDRAALLAAPSPATRCPRRRSRRPWRSPTSSRRWRASSASAQLPTGDKDPFGLRRAALGVVRILIEKRLPLSIAEPARPRVPGVQRRRRARSPCPKRSPISSTIACAVICASRATRRTRSKQCSSSGRSASTSFPISWLR